MKVAPFCFFSFLVLLNCLDALAQNDVSLLSNQEASLLRRLQENLTKFCPPPDLYNRTVYINLELTQFLQLDQKLGVIVLTLMVTLTYYVPSVAWDPVDFKGIRFLALPENTAWTPDVG